MAVVGDRVLYRLNDQDAISINVRRRDAKAYRQSNPRMHPGGEGATGFIAHVGNDAREGQVFPAVVVADWSGGSYVNLQVTLDGNDTYWATSRGEGDLPGQWAPVD